MVWLLNRCRSHVIFKLWSDGHSSIYQVAMRVVDRHAGHSLWLKSKNLIKGAGLQSGIERGAPLARLHTITLWSLDLFVHKPSQLPREHTARLPFFGARNYSNTQAFTVLPRTHLLLGQESARVSKVPCLGAQRRSTLSAAEDRTRNVSLVRRAHYHWATKPPKESWHSSVARRPFGITAPSIFCQAFLRWHYIVWMNTRHLKPSNKEFKGKRTDTQPLSCWPLGVPAVTFFVFSQPSLLTKKAWQKTPGCRYFQWPSAQARVSAHGFRNPGNPAWAEHFSRGSGMTLSTNHSSCLVFPTDSTGCWYLWRFEKLTSIFRIARDTGRLSAKHVGSFRKSEWVGISSIQIRRAQ